MSTLAVFLAVLNTHGSDVIYHRDRSTTPCPCRTREGYRDPLYHLQNPLAPECNPAGMLPDSPTDFTVKAWCQPIQSTRATRLQSEVLEQMFGDIQADDHLGVFPYEWNSNILEFHDWGQATQDYILYDGRKFTVVNSNLFADPDEGVEMHHHWEVGMRLIR